MMVPLFKGLIKYRELSIVRKKFLSTPYLFTLLASKLLLDKKQHLGSICSLYTCWIVLMLRRRCSPTTERLCLWHRFQYQQQNDCREWQHQSRRSRTGCYCGCGPCLLCQTTRMNLYLSLEQWKIDQICQFWRFSCKFENQYIFSETFTE